MVPRNPEDASETCCRFLESLSAMLGALTYVAAQDEPIVRSWLQLLESFAVAFEGEMNVADSPEATRRIRWRGRSLWRRVLCDSVIGDSEERVHDVKDKPHAGISDIDILCADVPKF